MGVFKFKQFELSDGGCGMKIGSDSVLLGAWFLPRYATARTVADIGAGSGLLALMAAQCCPQARVTAVELDSLAAEACRANALASPWADRIDTVCTDFAIWKPRMEAQPEEEAVFDIIISNPPYFTTGEQASDAARAAARHQNGLTYGAILATRHLVPGGHTGLVAPADMEQDIIFDATIAGMRLCRLCRVQTSPRKTPTRILLDFMRPATETSASEAAALKNRPDPPLAPEVQTLSMRQADGSYSDEYRALTNPFYIKL